jgi:hypothetical protein
MALIVEVGFDRHDDSAQKYSNDDDTMGYLDDYVKYFLFTPEDGWRDYSGRSIAR